MKRGVNEFKEGGRAGYSNGEWADVRNGERADVRNGERAKVRMKTGQWRVGGSMFPDQPGLDPEHGMDPN